MPMHKIVDRHDEGGTVSAAGPDNPPRQALQEITTHPWHRPVLQTLADGPKAYTETQKMLSRYASGPRADELDRALRELAHLGLVERTPAGWVVTDPGTTALQELDYLDRLPAAVPDTAARVAQLNPAVAHPARRYDYWLGGKDNFAADRQSAEEFERLVPGLRAGVRANREVLGRIVRHLTAEQGIRQFLDIGTGLPTAHNTHDVAQSVAPSSRVVYVDNDPLVLTHARALLTSTAEGRTAYIDADLRSPRTILDSAEVRDTLDFSRPVALLLVAVLHFIPGDGVVEPMVQELVDALPEGSFLAVTHLTHDFLPPAVVASHEEMQKSGRSDFWMRSKAEVSGLFSGLEILSPGVVPPTQWRPDADTEDYDLAVINGWAAVGRKAG
jgi:DNA-binding HxlR family transcriptional regulator